MKTASIVNSDLQECDQNKAVRTIVNEQEPMMISEHLLPKIKTKRKPVKAIHRSMNTTAGGGV